MAASTISINTGAIRMCGWSSHPSSRIAFFGGDPDNFEFPRYDWDVSYLRVYDNGKPLDTSANYFQYAAEDAKPGDLTFTVRHPGATDRLNTVAELEYARDVRCRDTLYRGRSCAENSPNSPPREPSRRASPPACSSASKIRSRRARAGSRR